MKQKLAVLILFACVPLLAQLSRNNVTGYQRIDTRLEIGTTTEIDPTTGIKGPVIACAAAPGDTTGPYQSLCIVPATGALWACTNAGGCTVAANWTAVGGGGAGFDEVIEYRAARCQNTIAGAGFSTPATGAPIPACVTGTNVLAAVLQFTETGVKTAQDHFRYRDGTTAIALAIKWRTAATSGSVVWQVATACVADGETMDPAWNAAQTVTDAAKGVANQLNDAAIASLTLSGCADGEQFFFKFFRDPDHGSDDLAATAELVDLAFTVTR